MRLESVQIQLFCYVVKQNYLFISRVVRLKHSPVAPVAYAAHKLREGNNEEQDDVGLHHEVHEIFVVVFQLFLEDNA